MTFDKPIYTAVLVPMPRRQADDLTLPLLDNETSPESTADNASIPFSHKTCNFLLGALIGMAFSVLGFRVLLNEYSLALWSRPQVVLFALVWSSITGIVAYMIFMATHYYALDTPYALWERLEYFFAMGVFLGFCAACTVTDVKIGLPLSSILLTLAVAIVWTMLMMAFAVSAAPAEVETNKSSRRRRRAKGTALPFVMV
jgi:hypothetical protein